MFRFLARTKTAPIVADSRHYASQAAAERTAQWWATTGSPEAQMARNADARMVRGY